METWSLPRKSLTQPSVILTFWPMVYFLMSSPQRVSVIVPVSSFKVASATLEGPREVVTSRGSEMAVIVASIVALALARREEIPAMAGEAIPVVVKLLALPQELE